MARSKVAGQIYKGSLTYEDYAVPKVDYDRVERNDLAVKQGKIAEEQFIKPYQEILDAWLAEK